VLLLSLIKLNPALERIGPEKVELAIFISLSWPMSKLILRQGTSIIHKKRGLKRPL
jgi:hypothetical protein